MTTLTPAGPSKAAVLERVGDHALAGGNPAGSARTRLTVDPQDGAAGGDLDICEDCGWAITGLDCDVCTPCADCGRLPIFCRCESYSTDPYDL